MKSFAITNNQNQPITLKTIVDSYTLAIFFNYKEAAKVLVELDLDDHKIIEVEINKT